MSQQASDNRPLSTRGAITRPDSRIRYCCFFFSSRRRHTRFDCDWSSDVCSSDLFDRDPEIQQLLSALRAHGGKSGGERVSFTPERARALKGETFDLATMRRRGYGYEIGRGAGWGRGEISGGAVFLKKKKKAEGAY